MILKTVLRVSTIAQESINPFLLQGLALMYQNTFSFVKDP